jgi:hypothetical protein
LPFPDALESGRTIPSLIRRPHGKAHARDPPLWKANGAEHDHSADRVPHPAFEFDQRLTW